MPEPSPQARLPSPSPQSSASAVRRFLPYVLAVAAVSFVAWMMPVRDRCWDPHAPHSTKVAVTQASGAGGGCVLHLKSGEVTIDAPACAQLTCEPGIVSTFEHANIGIIFGMWVVYWLGTIAWAARWRALLAFAGVELPLGKVWRISVEAQAGGILLPGGLGGDALRVASVVQLPTRAGETRAPVSIVIASMLLDRGVGLAFIAGLAALMGVLSGGVQAGPLVAALGAVPVGVVLGLVALRVAPPSLIGKLSQGKLGRVLGPVLAYVRDPRAPRAIATAALFSVGVAAVQFAVIRGFVLALGATPNGEKWVYVGAAMGFIVSAIPALPGGWGTADAAYVFFFGLGGLSSGVALATCLLFRLFWYSSGVVGALLQIARRENRAPAVAVNPGGGS